MDDDGNRTLDFNEFKKGLRDYGLYLEPKVKQWIQFNKPLSSFRYKGNRIKFVNIEDTQPR